MTSELTFVASEEKGEVDAILIKPRKPLAVLVLAHGAGANLRHAHMTNIAEALAEASIATLRFNFPICNRASRAPTIYPPALRPLPMRYA